jgi:hypothetical protein
MPLAVDLHFLSGRRPGVYDFSGTGISPAEDADSAFYQIDTSTLPLSSMVAQDLIAVRGHVNAFGSAPQDFLAQTVVDLAFDMRSASFIAVWEPASAEPFHNMGSGRIELDLESTRSILKVLGVPPDLTNPLERLSLVAPDSGRGVYAVRVRGRDEIHLYRNFADLVEELMVQFDSGGLLKRLGAHGRYNKATGELITGRAGFDFFAPSS